MLPRPSFLAFAFALRIPAACPREVWLLPFFVVAGGSGAGSLRLLRLLRLTRVVRLMRALPELVTLVTGVAAAARLVAATVTTLALILYIFALVFSNQLSEENESYASVPTTMLHMLVIGVLLDDITPEASALAGSEWSVAALFVLFVTV